LLTFFCSLEKKTETKGEIFVKVVFLVFIYYAEKSLKEINDDYLELNKIIHDKNMNVFVVRKY